MAESYKILGQARLTTTSPTDIYTVPTATETVISTLIITNVGTASTTYDIAIRQGGEILGPKQYIAKDVPIARQDATTLTLGITLEATDVVTAVAADADFLSFNIFGTEITA